MREAVDKVSEYCAGISNEKDFTSKSKTVDACIRNFQILGEAAGQVPEPIRKQLKEISWREIRGMRNLLVHQYFGVSHSILWNTIKNDLPELKKNLDTIAVRIQETSHPWRICPPGEYYVRQSKVSRHLREGHSVKEHLRRDHCRESNKTLADLLTPQETQDIAEIFFKELSVLPSSNNLKFGSRGSSFDHLIGGWTKYWNDLLKPEPPLDPNLVKALIASESSFVASKGKNAPRLAKGLMQLMPLTVKALSGFRGELKDHLFEINGAEVFEPSVNIAAGIRWLFQKRITASRRLKRAASWEEAVSEYKDYLRRKLPKGELQHRGMKTFHEMKDRLSKK